MRCLALFTGGLDSQLAVRLMQQQGVEVVGLHVVTPLCSPDNESAKDAATRLGIDLQTADAGDAFCQALRQPRFGRLGRAAPCLDCRIATFAAAAIAMADRAADFVISGEVVGQRPRTASRELEVVAHHAGLGDLLLRPLSAGLLPATRPEQRGWIDRCRLMSLQGKGRKEQLRLAAELGIDPAPSPRAECPLLAEQLAGRVLEMLQDSPSLTPWDLELAPIGRHVRIDERTRIVVSRNRTEGKQLARLAASSDRATLIQPVGFVGPAAIVVGDVNSQVQDQTLRLLAQYGRCDFDQVRATATRGGQLLGEWRLDRAVSEAT
jgi:tRNA-specific 2-thiouridylase